MYILKYNIILYKVYTNNMYKSFKEIDVEKRRFKIL